MFDAGFDEIALAIGATIGFSAPNTTAVGLSVEVSRFFISVHARVISSLFGIFFICVSMSCMILIMFGLGNVGKLSYRLFNPLTIPRSAGIRFLTNSINCCNLVLVLFNSVFDIRTAPEDDCINSRTASTAALAIRSISTFDAVVGVGMAEDSGVNPCTACSATDAIRPMSIFGAVVGVELAEDLCVNSCTASTAAFATESISTFDAVVGVRMVGDGGVNSRTASTAAFATESISTFGAVSGVRLSEDASSAARFAPCSVITRWTASSAARVMLFNILLSGVDIDIDATGQFNPPNDTI